MCSSMRGRLLSAPKAAKRVQDHQKRLCLTPGKWTRQGLGPTDFVVCFGVNSERMKLLGQDGCRRSMGGAGYIDLFGSPCYCTDQTFRLPRLDKARTD